MVVSHDLPIRIRISPGPSAQDVRVPFDLMAQDPRTEDPRNQDLKDFAKVEKMLVFMVVYWWLNDGLLVVFMGSMK